MNSESEEDLGISRQELQPETVSLVDFIEAARRHDVHPGAAVRRERERMFLQTRIFADLPILNPNWDSAQIDHFTRTDFLTVLDRCSEAGLKVFGVEVFSADGTFIDITIQTRPTGPSHHDFVKNFSDQPCLNFCVS